MTTNPPPIAPGTCPQCDTIASKHGCGPNACYGPPAPAERDRRANAQQVAYDARWTDYVREHGDAIWRAAGHMARSPRLASIITTFLRIGYLSPGETRLVRAILADFDRADGRRRVAA